MSEFKQNTGGQNVMFTATLIANGNPATTGVVLEVSGDGSAPAPAAGTLTNRGSGRYNYVPTAAETNFALMSLHIGGATINAYTINVWTTPIRVSELNNFNPAADSVNVIGDKSGYSLAAAQAFNNTGQTANLPADVKLWLATAPLPLSSQLVQAVATAVGDKTGYQIAGTLNTLDDLEAALKALIDSGTAQAAANHASEDNGEITLAATAPAVDHGVPVYSLVLIRSGPGAGQVRAVRSYNGTTKRAITVPAWQTGGIPNNTSTYEVFAAPLELAKLVEPEGAITADVALRALLAALAGTMDAGVPTASDAQFKAPGGAAPVRLQVGYSQAPDNIDRSTVDISGSK